MRPLVTHGRQGAAVFIRADMNALGLEIGLRARRDPLWRESIVYLTCLHETGHALGLAHTADFADIMYSFQFGGDIPDYFGRYRRILASSGVWLLAPTWGFRAIKEAALGGSPWPAIGMCAVVSVAYLAIALVCLAFFERLARSRASLRLA